MAEKNDGNEPGWPIVEAAGYSDAQGIFFPNTWAKMMTRLIIIIISLQ